MTPQAYAELEAVARDLERLSMNWAANRVRSLLGPTPDDERPCRIQDDAGNLAAIPWGLAEILYPAYGHDQTLERMHERGGFGRREIGMLAVDQYGARDGKPGRPRLARWPLLDLYDMARANLAAALPAVPLTEDETHGCVRNSPDAPDGGTAA